MHRTNHRQKIQAASEWADRCRRHVHLTRAIGEADPPDALDLQMREQNMYFRQELVKAVAALARAQAAAADSGDRLPGAASSTSCTTPTDAPRPREGRSSRRVRCGSRAGPDDPDPEPAGRWRRLVRRLERELLLDYRRALELDDWRDERRGRRGAP